MEDYFMVFHKSHENEEISDRRMNEILILIDFQCKKNWKVVITFLDFKSLIK